MRKLMSFVPPVVKSRWALLLVPLAGLFFFALKSGNQKAAPGLNERLRQFLKDEQVKNAWVGVHAVRLSDNKELVAVNPQKAMAPASALKLFTTAAIWQKAGGNMRFTTRLILDGTSKDKNKTFSGNLLVQGGGDPAFASPRFKGIYHHPVPLAERWAKKVADRGIDTINGDLLADVSFFHEQAVPDTWIYEDIGNYYGAGANGLSYRENAYKIVFRSPPGAGHKTSIIRTEPEMQGLHIINKVKTAANNRDNAYIYGIPESNTIIIRGTIPAGREAFTIKGSMPRPAYTFLHKLKQHLADYGVVLKGKLKVKHFYVEKGNPDTLAVLASPKLATLAEYTNTKSINLYAEHLGRQLARYSKQATGPEDAAHAIRSFWKNRSLPVKGMQLYDCSGLSRSNAVTARQFTSLLQFMNDSSRIANAFMQSLPIAGQSGTLRYFGRNTALDGNLRAKSGSMDNIRAYAGYVNDKNGHRIAFAIMLNNYTGSSSAVRNKIASLLEALALMS